MRYSYYKSVGGAWALHAIPEDDVEEFYAFPSERRLRAYAREHFGAPRWKDQGGGYWTAEETYNEVGADVY